MGELVPEGRAMRLQEASVGELQYDPKVYDEYRKAKRAGRLNNENHPEQVCEALDAWVCRPGMTQEQATILITEAFWALKERPNIDVQRVTFNDGEVDQRALGVNRVKIFERWKAIDTRDKRKNSRR